MGLDRGHLLRVLFVTTEMDDFVRVGGLAAVSAALPRALRSHTDVRIMLPGYRDVIEQLTHIEIVGQCDALVKRLVRIRRHSNADSQKEGDQEDKAARSHNFSSSLINTASTLDSSASASTAAPCAEA